MKNNLVCKGLSIHVNIGSKLNCPNSIDVKVTFNRAALFTNEKREKLIAFDRYDHYNMQVTIKFSNKLLYVKQTKGNIIVFEKLDYNLLY
jgi:hypothetical protein